MSISVLYEIYYDCTLGVTLCSNPHISKNEQRHTTESWQRSPLQTSPYQRVSYEFLCKKRYRDPNSQI